MSLNQLVRLTAGLVGIIARVEKLDEPGQPRRYWDDAGAVWSPSPASHIPATEDPDCPGNYLIQKPSSVTAAWPDQGYRLTVLNPALTGPDKIVADPWIVTMVGGDDGTGTYPSYTLNVLGGTLTIMGAKFNSPTPPKS